SSRRRHTRSKRDWSSDVCSSDLTFYMNPDGTPKGGRTCQGYRDDSFWARGQAWGVYGSAIGYTYTHDATFLDVFRKALDFYLSRSEERRVGEEVRTQLTTNGCTE